MSTNMGMPRLLVINICLFLIFMFVFDIAECRGGRGGRFGGRYRSSRYRYRSSYRSSRVSRVGRYAVARTKYSGYRLGSPSLKKAAIIAGTVYGAQMWMRRSTYRHRRTYPEVCYNDMYVGNRTVSYHGRFVCPGELDPDDYSYCCGDIGQQHCCQFFDTSSKQGAGRIAGTVIGVIVAVIVVGVCAYCCFKKRKSFSGKTLSTHTRKHDGGVTYGHSHADESGKPLQPMGYTAAPPPPPTMNYGIQPTSNGAPPNPPSYGDAINTPYPAAPYPDPTYKPPMPSDDVNRGDLPYGLNPEPSPSNGYMYGQQLPTNDSPYPSGAPYPPPEGAAPYPPPEGAPPYPPATASAPYPPPSGGNMYPQ